MWVWEPERCRFEASPATPWLCHFDSGLQNMHLYLELKKPIQGKELRRWHKPAGVPSTVQAPNSCSLNALLSQWRLRNTRSPRFLPEPHSQPRLSINLVNSFECPEILGRALSIYFFKAPPATSLEQTEWY